MDFDYTLIRFHSCVFCNDDDAKTSERTRRIQNDDDRLELQSELCSRFLPQPNTPDVSEH